MCALVIGNSQYEGSTELMMQKYFQDFLEVYGNFYISGPLWTDAHPAYSGVMFNSQVAKTFLNSGLVLEQERCHQFNIEPDEGFLSIILGALNKKIAISGRVVSVRGTPLGSYSKSEYWQKEWRQNMFVVYFKLLEWSLKNSNGVVYKLALNLLTKNFRYEGPFDKIKALVGESQLLLQTINLIASTKQAVEGDNPMLLKHPG